MPVKKKTISYGMVAKAYSSALLAESPDVDLDRLLRQYGKSVSWTYIAVNRIANASAQIPVQIIRKARKGKPNAIVEGPVAGLRDIVENPNPFQSYFDFMEEGQTYLDLAGNSYIELAKIDKLGRPHEMYWLPPNKMTIIPDERKIVKGYIYNVNGKEINYPANEIIHMKYAHPSNDYYGLSPLQVAQYSVLSDQDAIQWNRNFMNKGAWPAGALETEKEVDEATEARIRSDIKRIAQGGKESVGRLLLLTGGLKYHTIALSPKDLDWLSSRRMNRDEILAIYGVPFAVAGLFSNEQTTARSAGVNQQVINFYLFSVFPRRKKMLSALNRGLVSLYPGGVELVDDVRNIPALKDDVQKELVRSQTFRTLTSSGWSVAMALGELYPHVTPPPWGNVAWMNQAMVPIKDETNPFVKDPNATPADTNVPTDPQQDPSQLSGDYVARALGLEQEVAKTLESILSRHRKESD